MYDPLKVEKTDHPDIVGGIVWADCELAWIRAYGTRCFNHGNDFRKLRKRLLKQQLKQCVTTQCTGFQVFGERAANQRGTRDSIPQPARIPAS